KKSPQALFETLETRIFFRISKFEFRLFLSDAAAVLVFDDVQAAFFFAGAAPTAGAFVFAVADRGGAGPAADAGIAAIVQGVVWHVVLDDEIPHIFLRPVQERVDLHKIELGVPLDHGSLSAIARLLFADRADP